MHRTKDQQWIDKIQTKLTDTSNHALKKNWDTDQSNKSEEEQTQEEMNTQGQDKYTRMKVDLNEMSGNTLGGEELTWNTM